MDGTTIIRLVNPTDEDYIDYNGDKRYRIPAHGEIVTQSAPVHEWLGDPDLRDDGRNNERTAEYTRLRARYGAYENRAVWERNKPKIEVWTMDGQRLLTIVDDPYLTAGTAEVDYGQNPEGVQEQIADYENRIAQLKAQ